jgi:hypothetical protein
MLANESEPRKRRSLRRQSSRSAVSDRCPGSRFFFGRGSDQTVTLRLLAGNLTYAAQRFSFLSRRLLRWLLVKSSTLHFAEDAFPLHLLFQHPESLVDVVVTDEYLNRMIP